MNDMERRRWVQAWFDTWNAHDLERILSHYAEDVEMVSPMIQKIMQEPSGRLRGKATLRAYWGAALARVPNLHFEPLSACWGLGSVVLCYKGVAGRTVAEVLELDPTGLVCGAHAHYAD